MATSAILQYQQKSFCGEVNEQDIRNAGFQCSPLDRMKSLSMSSSDFFEWNVFQIAAKNQVHKNKCMTEQIDALLADKELKKVWYTQLTQAWLGVKKAELILNLCQREVLSQLETANIKRFGLKSAYEKAMSQNTFGTRKLLDEKWKDICTDEKQLSALRAASDLFQFALPVVSDPHFFKIVEDHRKMVLNTSSNAPVSDQDILTMDLHDISNLKLKKNKSFEHAVNQSISDLAKERRDVTRKIELSKKGDQFQLGSELKDYIYEDQTLLDTLKSRNLLTHDGAADGNPAATSRGSLCLLSKYQTSTSSAIGGFLIESALLGKLLFNVGKLAAQGAKTPKALQSLTTGLTLKGYEMMNQQISKSCPDPNFSDKTRFTKKTISMIEGEDAAAMKASELPTDFDYNRWELALGSEKAPSCKDEQKNFLVNSLYRTNCLLDSLLTVAPLKVSLPLMLGISH